MNQWCWTSKRTTDPVQPGVTAVTAIDFTIIITHNDQAKVRVREFF